MQDLIIYKRRPLRANGRSVHYSSKQRWLAFFQDGQEINGFGCGPLEMRHQRWAALKVAWYAGCSHEDIAKRIEKIIE